MNKKFFKFSMCILYKQTGVRETRIFELKQQALDWFENFIQDNKQPVTVIFYHGITPYWVYYGKSDN